VSIPPGAGAAVTLRSEAAARVQWEVEATEEEAGVETVAVLTETKGVLP
jgi:hypothetical protein